MTSRFAEAYPHLARWIAIQGWIEVGDDGMGRPFVRVLDEGGLIWEGGDAREAVDDALHLANVEIGRWMEEQKM